VSKICQEKFETRAPQNRNDDAHGGWVNDASARAKKNIPNRAAGHDSISRSSELEARLNRLPPGMNIEDQDNAAIREVGINTAGQMGNKLAKGDRDQDLDARSLRRGFTRRPLRPTDDQYTREHNDAFYDTVEVDGVEGYLERNNNCDRL
jgi:hypothetical protein